MMKELDVLKQVWQERLGSLATNLISKEEFMALLQAKTADIKTRTLQRVRKEILTYLVLLVIPVVSLFTRYGASPRAVFGTIGVLALMGLIIGALSYKEYQLRTLPLHGSLRESLAALIATIDSTTRLYMAAYMICIVIPIAILEAFLLWRDGLTFLPIVALVAGIAFVAWCYQSGRGYLERAFGRSRAALANCLTELEGG